MRARADEFVARAYQILGLPAGACEEDVDRAHASLIHHDNSGSDAWERIKEIDWAYDTLIRQREPRQTETEPAEGPAAHEDVYQVTPKVRPLLDNLNSLVSTVDDDLNPLCFYGRALMLVIVAAWGVKFILAPVQGDYVGSSFMHLINLPFHEAGHLIFSFLGDFMRVLGGTLAQILIPLVCVIAFLKRRDPFAASCALWWMGQNFIDVAPYIYDARAGELMLLGGVTGQDNPDFHDWHNILERLDLLSYDHSIAYASKLSGVFLILLSFAWGGYALARQYRILKQPVSREQ